MVKEKEGVYPDRASRCHCYYCDLGRDASASAFKGKAKGEANGLHQ